MNSFVVVEFNSFCAVSFKSLVCSLVLLYFLFRFLSLSIYNIFFYCCFSLLFFQFFLIFSLNSRLFLARRNRFTQIGSFVHVIHGVCIFEHGLLLPLLHILHARRIPSVQWLVERLVGILRYLVCCILLLFFYFFIFYVTFMCLLSFWFFLPFVCCRCWWLLTTCELTWMAWDVSSHLHHQTCHTYSSLLTCPSWSVG